MTDSLTPLAAAIDRLDQAASLAEQTCHFLVRVDTADVRAAIEALTRTPDPRIIELEGEVERLRELAKMSMLRFNRIAAPITLRNAQEIATAGATDCRATLNPKTTEGER